MFLKPNNNYKFKHQKQFTIKTNSKNRANCLTFLRIKFYMNCKDPRLQFFRQTYNLLHTHFSPVVDIY